LALFAQNVNGIAFLVGFWGLLTGIDHFSRGAAYVVGGLIVMTLAAWPYLRRARKS
jgi:hypothetical protein